MQEKNRFFHKGKAKPTVEDLKRERDRLINHRAKWIAERESSVDYINGRKREKQELLEGKRDPHPVYGREGFFKFADKEIRKFEKDLVTIDEEVADLDKLIKEFEVRINEAQSQQPSLAATICSK